MVDRQIGVNRELSRRPFTYGVRPQIDSRLRSALFHREDVIPAQWLDPAVNNGLMRVIDWAIMQSMTRHRSPLAQMIVGILGVGAAYVIQVGAAQSGSHLAVPADAKTAIVDAFRTYRLVGLGDDHGNMPVSDFRLSLLRDPRLATVVNDVVVEFGSSRYQDLIDRFIVGESVPDIELRQVWENTTVPNGVWDRPIYADVFRVIRAVNAQLPETRQLRVLLADPPIDWSEIETAEQVRNWSIQRGAFAADLIQREVIAKNRRALAIFGDGHFQARTARPPRGMAARLSLLGVELLAIASNSGPISKLQPDVARWPTPSIAFVRNTPIGAAGYDLFYGPLPPGDYWAANRKFEDHYDAVLYLGPASIQRSPLTFPRCTDSDYVAMRIARMEVAGMRAPPGAPTAAERIRQACRPL